jgi:CheY-like chemotaxis protein
VPAGHKQLELMWVVAPAVPARVVGDAGRLRQVLVNLLGNAVKFTDRGEVSVMVTAVPAARGMTELQFAVRDTGSGIAEADQARLFEPFVQVDSRTTRSHQGTGLGLAISRRLAGLMGGGITLTSTPGKGSTFHLTIRARSEEATAAGRPLRDVSALARRRILIVDDNPTALQIARDQAQAWAMDPICVSSAAAALGLLHAGERFDLALIDWQMPDVDGPTLIALLRQIPSAAELPVVLLSSVTATRDQLDDLADGAIQLHLKPIRPDELAAALTSALAPAATIAAPLPTTPTFDPATATAHPLRILTVDDNDINQLVMTRILERLGYRPDVAANGLEAVEACRRQCYDLVLMDIEMPEMDGFDATSTIRAASPTAPRIIGLSAHATDDVGARCLAAGMDGYLSKPLVAEQLLEQVAATTAARDEGAVDV